MRSDLDNGVPASSATRAPSTEASESAPDLTSPSCASNADSCFKDNIDMNKCETPKLSLEPLQMKRKKKGGGYNLRKSLAWDRAFFTEEGILDPLELSKISDVSCREALGGFCQDEDMGKDGKKDWSSTKLHSSSSKLMRSTSQTPQRFPTHGIKPGSRYGDCPRPLPSPSLKRPANVNVSKAAGKESKLPKFPGLKTGLSPTCAMTRSTILRANHVKHNQITQPDFSTQRHADLKSSSKSLKKAQNASNYNSLQSAHHSDGNSGNSLFRRHSSINNSPVMVDKANNSGSKIISETATPIRPNNSSEGLRYGSTTLSTSFSMNAQISGRTMNSLQDQTTKPSGLRMPSPSLSFFSQPKTSVFRDLPMRVTETDVFGSQKPGSLSLQDNLRRTPNTFSRILERTRSTGNAVNSSAECMMSSHVSAIELTKPNSKQNSTHKIQDLPKKDIVERVSHEEAVLQNIGIEVLPQVGFHQQIMHNICKKAIEVYPIHSESRGSGWRNAESGSKQNYAVQDSKSIDAIDEPLKGKHTCNSLVLNHGPTQYIDAHDERPSNTLTVQSDCGKTCKPEHEPHMEKTDTLEYSLGDTDKKADKDDNVSKIKERACEQLCAAKQNVSCCSGSIKALGQRQSEEGSPYFESKQLCENLLKESPCIEVLIDKLTAGEAHLQNPVFDLTTRCFENDFNSVTEDGDDIKQTRKDSEDICHRVEMESEKNVKLNTDDRLLPVKNILLQNSQQEEHFEKLMLLPDRNDGDKVIDTKMPISLSPGKRHEINLLREETIVQPLISMELDFADNSMSSESCNSLTNTILDCNVNNKGNGNLLLNVTGNLSYCLHQDTQRTEIDNCSHFSDERRKESACIRGDSADNQLISTMISPDIESDSDNLRDLRDTGTVLVQSAESNMLNDVCPKQPECPVSASDGFVAENLVHSNDRMQTCSQKSADMYSEDNALGSNEDSVTGQNESCNDVCETVGHCEEEMTVLSRVEPFSDTVKGEVSENINCSFSGLHPELDQDKVEAALAPKSNHQNGLNEKSLSLVLPQNAIPFSDEWLAAIEAAGEDILTKKSGAVQNSPPDKSLPEPNPWSPVKRKNNQIGPFDCTKFTVPTDSI